MTPGANHRTVGAASRFSAVQLQCRLAKNGFMDWTHFGVPACLPKSTGHLTSCGVGSDCPQLSCNFNIKTDIVARRGFLRAIGTALFLHSPNCSPNCSRILFPAIAMSTTPLAPANPQAESWLVQIPLEVLIRITYFISTRDLSNVRLSCKALEQGVFSFFSHEFFRKKQFMVSTDSLQALVDISKHPTLSPYLKHVIISTDRPKLNNWVQDRNDEVRACLEVAASDHMQLLATGGLRDMLVEAFANLTNLETVDIRDFNSRSRNRDGLGSQWKSYGAVAMAVSTGAPVSPGATTDQDPYTTQLFSAVTAALATAQARPKSIEVLLRSGTSWRPFALHDTAFYIPPRMEASMSPLLAGLKSLHLSLALTHSTRMRPFMIQKFLSLTPNLTWLRLNFSNTTKNDSESVLAWLALKDGQSPATPIDMDPIRLDHLERLDLGSNEIEQGTLVKLVAKFAPTLISLYLRRVSLLDLADHTREVKSNPWEICLRAMSKMPNLNLRALDLSSIAVSSLRFRANVTFKTAETSKPASDWNCSTNRLTLDKAIAQTVDAMTVEWPHIDSMDGMYSPMSVSS